MTARASLTAAAVTIALLTGACGASRSGLVAASATTFVLGTVILVGPVSSEDPGPPNEAAATVFGSGLILAGIACGVAAIVRGPAR